MMISNPVAGDWSDLAVDVRPELGVCLQFDSGPEYILEPETWNHLVQWVAGKDDRYLNPRNTRPSIN
jgi:hypothetical protein